MGLTSRGAEMGIPSIEPAKVLKSKMCVLDRKQGRVCREHLHEEALWEIKLEWQAGQASSRP